jgi:hypothetical protein
MRGVPQLGGATQEGCVPLTLTPCEPAPEVAVLPMREWVRRKSLGATNKHKPLSI